MTVKIDNYDPFQAGRPKLIKFEHHDGTYLSMQHHGLDRWLQRQLQWSRHIYRVQVDHLYSPSLGVAFIGITTPRDKVTEVSLESPRVQDRLWAAAVKYVQKKQITVTSVTLRLECRNGGFIETPEQDEQGEEV